MEAIIVSFRRGRKTQKDSHMILEIDGVSDRKKAEPLVGKKVIWTSPAKKEIKGIIKAVHGNSGAVRAIFDTGMPGQSVGNKVKIE